MIQNYISYFADCYKADNREFTIANFFSSKYENQFIIKQEEELINHKMPVQFLPSKQAESILQNLALHQNDKELLYTSLFFLGKRQNFQKRTTTIAAPLFYYKATIVEKEGDYFIKLLQPNERLLNTGFLKTLEYKTSFEEFYEAYENRAAQHIETSFEFISILNRLIQKHILNVTADTLIFPKLQRQTYLKKKLQNITDKEIFSLESASGLIVSSKANNINGVVNELEKLKKVDDYSTALQSFFSTTVVKENNPDFDFKIPVLLNQAQEQIVLNAHQYHKSVIYGPPGTGKSYTISAIAQDYISKGKSVLIATKTAQALDVIENKLDDFKIGQFTLKIGGNYYKRSALAYLRRISNNVYRGKFSSKNYNTVRANYHNTHKDLNEYEVHFDGKVAKEIKRIDLKFEASFIQKFINKLDIALLRKLEMSEHKIIETYYQLLDRHEYWAQKFIYLSILEKLIFSAQNNRLELLKMTSVFETKDKSEISNQLSAFDLKKIVDFLPIWLVKIDEASTALPLQKDVFDILIIDEATQCDIASCLPLLQRAKKVIVAGDTNQLRHISFLSTHQMKSLQQKHHIKDSIKFNYRKKSLLDFTLESTPEMNQVIMLDEHYRSLPEIINFSNREFYDNGLRIMTDTPQHKELNAVFVHQTQGKQLSNGTNTQEGEAILFHMQQIIDQEQDLKPNQASTIGILSPFREQTKYLTKLIQDKFDLKTIKKHQIRLGTPYHFQGEEKDVMFISLAIDKNSHFASLNYLNKTDVFNVAITRARHQQHVYTSIESQDLNANSLLRKFLETYDLNHQQSNQVLEQDKFSEAVAAHLTSSFPDLIIHPAYHIAGLNIDLLLTYKKKYLGIDLIGYPGHFKEAFSLERYKILKRVGIEIFPMSYLSWTKDQKALLAKLDDKLNNL